MARINRSVRLFVIHGREDGEPMDYVNFLEWLHNLTPRDRIARVNPELSIGLERSIINTGLYELRFVAGNPDEEALLFDTTTGTTTVAETPPNQWVASATRVVIDPAARLAAIEGRRNGITAANIERFFIRPAERLEYRGRINFDLSPVPAESFLEQINQFTRVREASITITRPNYDWDDSDELLSQLAEDSGGHKAEAGVTAARGEALSKTSGVVAHISIIATGEVMTNVSNARITGYKEGDEAESSVTLQKHQETAKVVLDTARSESDQDDSIFVRAADLISRARSRASEVIAEIHANK